LKSNAAIKDSDVRTATHRCWINLASCFGSEMIPHLAHIVPTITRVFSEEYTPGGAPSQADHRNDEDDEEDDEEEEDEFDEAKMEAAETEAQQVDEERMTALALYRELLDILGAQMIQFNEEIWSVIVQQSEDWNGSVQEQVAELVPALSKLFPRSNETKLVAGETVPLPAGAESLLQSAVKLMLSYIRFSVDPSAVAKAIDAISSLTGEYGQVVLMQPATNMDAFLTAAKRILKGQAICQQNMQSSIPSELRQQIEAASALHQERDEADEDEEDDDDQLEKAFADNEDEENEQDLEAAEVVVRSLLDCLAAFAKARGSAFQSTFT